jgi:hypothetical protein
MPSQAQQRASAAEAAGFEVEPAKHLAERPGDQAEPWDGSDALPVSRGWVWPEPAAKAGAVPFEALRRELPPNAEWTEQTAGEAAECRGPGLENYMPGKQAPEDQSPAHQTPVGS